MKYGITNFKRGGEVMYANLLNAMKQKKVTALQIANLLECRPATVSDKLNGTVKCGFYFAEAQKIKKVFFQEYDYDFLFEQFNNEVLSN